MKRTTQLFCLGTSLALTVCGAFAATGQHGKPAVDISKLPPASPKQDVTYASDIKPILDRSCVKCHGPHKPKARLRLDSLKGILKGGEDGKVIKPGQSAESVLVQNVAHAGDPDDYMPPPRNKAGIKELTKAEIGLIRAWIDQEAK